MPAVTEGLRQRLDESPYLVSHAAIRREAFLLGCRAHSKPRGIVKTDVDPFGRARSSLSLETAVTIRIVR